MDNSKPFDKMVSDIVNDYFDTYISEEPTMPCYRIVDDIASAYLELKPNMGGNPDANIEKLSAYNGFTVPPNKVGGTFIVLINKNILLENMKNNNFSWIGTIAHETTHVQDFVQYVQMVGDEDYEEIVQYSQHGIFNIWTEIHARSKGYYFTRKYTLGPVFMKSRILLQDIIEREIPLQWDLLYRNYHSTDNGYEQAYLVAQYIGRLITLQQLYPDDFNDEWINDHFDVNTWMTELFMFFKAHPTLEVAFEHFDEMKGILRKNFKGI